MTAAANALGISGEVMRMRLKRGTLRSEREAGTVYVILEADQTRPHAERSPDQTPDQTALIASLENQVRFLREELARKDAILLRMAEVIPQLEAPRKDAPESSQPRSSTPTPTDPSEGRHEHDTRPWWQRWFGA